MLDPKLINRLFVRFQSNWGHGWSSQFATDNLLKAAKNEWAIALSQFSPEVIAKAIHYCQWGTRQFTDHPPKLPQFIEICRMYQPKVERQEVKRLPAPTPYDGMGYAGCRKVLQGLGFLRKRGSHV